MYFNYLFMRILKVLFIVLLFFLSGAISAQDSISHPVKPDVLSFGVGFGFDYGGIGGNLTAYPTKNVGLFAGAGWAIAGIGYNAGVKVRFLSGKPKSALTFSGIAMYGYNSVVVVVGDSRHNKIFYGPTVGVGLDFKLKPESIGYWTVSLLVPIRSSEYRDYMDDLELNEGVEFKGRLRPIGVTFGYRFIIF